MAKQPPTALRVTYAESVMTVQAGTVGNRRHCINLVPGLTVRLPGGKEP